MKLKLLRYDIEFEYLKGRLMHIADLLSRSYLTETESDDSYMYEVVHCIGLASYLQCTEQQQNELVRETNNDVVLKQLIDFIKNGWPQQEKILSLDVQKYYNLRASLSVDKNLLFMNSKLVVPISLRQVYLKNLHEGHIGITKMKQLARRIMYWPQINKQIETFVKQCNACQRHQNT